MGFSSKWTARGAVILTSMVLGCGPASVSDDDGLDASSSELMAKQERLENGANALDERLAASPALAGISVDAASNRLVVYVAGEDAAVTGALATSGLAYEVRPAALSKAKAQAFDAQLETDDETLGVLGVDVTSYGADETGTRYEVTVSGDAEKATWLLRARYPEMASVLTVSSEGVTPFVSRMDDAAPYLGGSRILVDKKNFHCTSGFSAKGSGGSTWVSSAYHCVDAEAPAVDTAAGHLIGKFTSTDPANDVAFIKATAGSYIYDEAFNAKTHSVFVKAAAHPHPGSLICFDGSYTARVCTGKVGHAIHWKITQPFTGKSYPVAGYYADEPHHKALAGEGDSGGPVYTRRSDGYVNAVGLISAGAPRHSAYCPDYDPKHERGCAWRVYFGDFKTIATKHHLSVGY